MYFHRIYDLSDLKWICRLVMFIVYDSVTKDTTSCLELLLCILKFKKDFLFGYRPVKLKNHNQWLQASKLKNHNQPWSNHRLTSPCLVVGSLK